MNSKWLDIYHQATYEVYLPEALYTIKLGENNDPLDERCQDDHVWCLVTAYNPKSVKQSLRENMVAQLQLIKHCSHQKHNYYFGRGRSADSSWIEDSLLIYNITPQEAIKIGQSYLQNAIVMGSHQRHAAIINLVK